MSSSTSTIISAIIAAKNTIRDKLIVFGLATSDSKLTDLAQSIDSIPYVGSITETVKEGDSYTIPAGYHDGQGVISGVSGGGNYELQSVFDVVPTKQQQEITNDNSHYGLSLVVVSPIPDKYQDTTNVTATAADVLNTKTFVDAQGSKQGTMPNRGGTSKTLDATADNQSYTILEGYHNGNGIVSIDLEQREATPSKSTQYISPSIGKVLSRVEVKPIPSQYVDVSEATKDSDDLTASGATVSVPAGYYPAAASKAVASGTAGTPTATKGTVSNNSVSVTPSVTNTTGYITGGTKSGTAVTVSASELVSGTKTITGSGETDVTNYASASVAAGSATAPASISGSSATVSTGTNTLTLTKTVSVTPSVSAGYVSAGTAGNSSVSLTAPVTTKASETYYPSSTDQTIAAGQYLTGAQTIKAVKITNLKAENIAKGVVVEVGDSVDSDRVAKITGTLETGVDTSDITMDSDDLEVSGATVTVPAGYYPSGASASVASGSAGTPTATKGTVTNNSISITPKVTNSTGYITGGTKSGTAVSVTASELVSGNKSITGSGSTDVTNYATATVAAGSATPPASISGTSATVSTGTNTLTLTKTVSVTPSVTAGYVASGTAGNSSVSLTASVTTKAAATLYPSTSDQTISSGQYLTGTQTIKAVTTTNLTADVIKSGVTVQVGDASDPDRVTSVTGTYTGDAGDATTENLTQAIGWNRGTAINNSGEIVTSSTSKYSAQFGIIPSKKYSLTSYKNSTTNGGLYVAFYNTTSFISRVQVIAANTTTGTKSGTFTTPSDCHSIRIVCGKAYYNIVLDTA